jgi:hypothetical protein
VTNTNFTSFIPVIKYSNKIFPNLNLKFNIAMTNFEFSVPDTPCDVTYMYETIESYIHDIHVHVLTMCAVSVVATLAAVYSLQ